jgi:nicotinamidase-related amidase
MSAALLIIDVQQALCFGEFAAFEAPRVIERINEVAAKVRAAGRPVIVIQHESPEGPLRHGSPGWQLATGLSTQPTDILIRKRATDSFHETELQSVLKDLGVSSLIICGLQSEFCVDTTTRRALALGYPVQLVSDGHSTMDSAVLNAQQITAHHNETLANITSFGPRVRAVPAAQVAMELP